MPPQHDKRGGRPPRQSPSHPQVDPPVEWICLGDIVAPFGLHGELKLLPQTDFPERIATHATLYLGPTYAPFALVEARPHGGVILLQLADVADVTAAEKLRGLSVFIPATEAAPLAEDQYYIHDLIGLRALHRDGRDLGVVADIFAGSAQELLAIKQPSKPVVLVPFVKAIIPSVDFTTRTITIDPPLGLFADDAATAADDTAPDKD